MRIIKIALSIMLTLALTQCASFDFARRVRQQGNLLPPPTIERLKVGMTKEDVAILMGNSLISPTFNNDRWDYAYTWRRGHGPIKKRTVVVYFSKDRVTRIERQL